MCSVTETSVRCDQEAGLSHCDVMEIVQTTTALYTTAYGLLVTETSLDSVGLYHGNKKQKHVLDHLCHEGALPVWEDSGSPPSLQLKRIVPRSTGCRVPSRISDN